MSFEWSKIYRFFSLYISHFCLLIHHVIALIKLRHLVSQIFIPLPQNTNKIQFDWKVDKHHCDKASNRSQIFHVCLASLYSLFLYIFSKYSLQTKTLNYVNTETCVVFFVIFPYDVIYHKHKTEDKF